MTGPQGGWPQQPTNSFSNNNAAFDYNPQKATVSNWQQADNDAIGINAANNQAINSQKFNQYTKGDSTGPWPVLIACLLLSDCCGDASALYRAAPDSCVQAHVDTVRSCS